MRRHEVRRPVICKNIATNDIWQQGVDFRDIGHATAKYDGVGIDDVAYRRQGATQPIEVSLEGGSCALIHRAHQSNDFLALQGDAFRG